MPFGDNSLPSLEHSIRQAAQAAETADQIADTCIRISLRHRIAAGEALAEARELVPPDAWPGWLARLGLAPRQAKSFTIFPAEYRSQHRPDKRKGQHAPAA